MRLSIWLLLTIFVTAVLSAPGFTAPACSTEVVDIYASVSGVVVRVPDVGERVRDGDGLVYVQTATDPLAVTAKATTDGTILEVLVKPREMITLEMVRRRAVLVRICKG